MSFIIIITFVEITATNPRALSVGIIKKDSLLIIPSMFSSEDREDLQ